MSITLTPTQQADVGAARAFAAAVNQGGGALAAYMHAPPGGDRCAVYAMATGWANNTIRDLLAIIDSLTEGSAS
jgi:hypothetical protein